jgi:predicted dehydrogenase
MTMKKVRIAMIGFGGIARTHYAGYTDLATRNVPFELVAICDIDKSQFEKQITINTSAEPVKIADSIHTYTNLDEMIANEEFDMADICLPTYLHCEYTKKMLRAGKHVLCEKPMALNSAECEEMLAVAKETGKKLMIGQCLRFSDSYRYVKKCIDEGTFGKLQTLNMYRLSAHPEWGFENWFQNDEKSGGCGSLVAGGLSAGVVLAAAAVVAIRKKKED